MDLLGRVGVGRRRCEGDIALVDWDVFLGGCSDSNLRIDEQVTTKTQPGAAYLASLAFALIHSAGLNIP